MTYTLKGVYEKEGSNSINGEKLKMGMKERNEAREPCPECNNRIYPRSKTKDWRCTKQDKIFTHKPIPENL